MHKDSEVEEVYEQLDRGVKVVRGKDIIVVLSD